MTRYSALLWILAAVTAGAWAQQVYKSVDPQGRVIYTDRPVEGAKPVDLPPVSTVPAVKAPESREKSPGAREAAGGEGRSKESSKESQARLSEAEAGLEAARRELAEQEQIRLGGEATNYQKYLDRVQRYRDDVTRREQEVEALRKGGSQ
ncbi:MAG TPA: DUF4124 domain-containing protein [Burkholderiales bacterium]